MSKISYSEKLKNPLWQKKRLEILKRDDFTCVLCHDKNTELHIHHKKYEYGKEPWEYPEDNFQTLCKHCHCVIEWFKGKKLTPIISSKYYDENIKIYTISTIFQSPKYGLILAINYYSADQNTTELVTIIEEGPFKEMDKLFLHARKLIK